MPRVAGWSGMVSTFGLRAGDVFHVAHQLPFNQPLNSKFFYFAAAESVVGSNVVNLVCIVDIHALAATLFAATAHKSRCQKKQERDEFLHGMLLLVDDVAVSLKYIVGADHVFDVCRVEGVIISDAVQFAAVAAADGDDACVLGADNRTPAVLLFRA